MRKLLDPMYFSLCNLFYLLVSCYFNLSTYYPYILSNNTLMLCMSFG